ncbi:hypothetical protein PAECIP111891_04303 [Paenibacillus allorhizoplanae]|uniref:Flagellar protein FliT n=1 Tax=Paenibacillus allorhizoplanae TaxID=2905648 RepID=A0ABM9CLZ2_9BACL|nr:hypothetical protein [Paenibacillus allorhizoplanae]CAH1215744.1 hypothetical protein PAECIP111891_04303 [Paenibacillus allorhizoplanae]
MGELVAELEKRTQQALAELTTMDIDQLSEYMEQRGLLMQALINATENASDGDKEKFKDRIESIVSLDPIFLQKLTKFRDQARSQLTKIDNGKTQKNAYDNQYDGDSYFFDKKK